MAPFVTTEARQRGTKVGQPDLGRESLWQADGKVEAREHRGARTDGLAQPSEVCEEAPDGGRSTDLIVAVGL